jgi:hypothetical protein
VYIHEIKLEIVNGHCSRQYEMSIVTDEMMTAVSAAEMPKQEPTAASNAVDEIELLEDGDTVEIVSDGEEDWTDVDSKLPCPCRSCQEAVLEFYPDYLKNVRKLSPYEVDSKTASVRRTIEWGYRIIDKFTDALWSNHATVTNGGYKIVDVWKVVQKYFCESQLGIWKRRMVARNLINE